MVNVSQMWREAHQRGAELVVIYDFEPTSLRDYEGRVGPLWTPYLIWEISTWVMKC